MIQIDQATLEKYPNREAELKGRMRAIEETVRGSTNNNFQRREKRFLTIVTNGALPGAPFWFQKGDTIQITNSGANDGLYEVAAAAGGALTLDLTPDEGAVCTVTRIEYPPDVVAGANDMLRWDIQYRPKVGVKSESLSRHTVTYLDLDATNSRDGYPAALTGFMNRHRKARF